jgi:sigma-54-interacting transcriptional regulator
MNSSIRLFAGTYNATAPFTGSLPRTMGGRAQGLDRDVDLARATRANVLVVGADQAVSNALAVIVADVEHATVLDRSSEPLRLPSPIRCAPTVVIRGIDRLTRDEQRELVDWLMVAKGRSRVVATTSRSLFSMLDAQEFSATLYYRLNTVYVDLT